MKTTGSNGVSYTIYLLASIWTPSNTFLRTSRENPMTANKYHALPQCSVSGSGIQTRFEF